MPKPIALLYRWIKNVFRKKNKFSYSYHSYTIPQYNFEGFDKTKDNLALMMPTKAHKPIRKWYQLFKKKGKPLNVKWTDNSDGSKTWEIIK